MTELIGRTLGSYQILEQLGRGGMADVYKAYQPSLDRYVAVKVMTVQLTREPDFPERFEREAKAVAQLEHPNILAVHDYGRQDEGSYIVMRYVEGGTLSDSMGVPLEMDRITKLMDQISSALHYAHENGVIHRDVKPSNVLLDRGDWPLLTDFGVARMVGASQQLTATGVGIGTPAYMSPEQGLGEKVDRRSDIYSLGVVLFQMLTGNLPFEAETPLAVVMKHIYDPLPIPSQVNPSIPQSIERVVLKAMAKSVDDRFQTAEEFSDALHQAVVEAEQDGALDRYAHVAPTTVAAVEEPAPKPGGKWSKRLLWLAPVGLVLVLGGLLLAIGIRGFPAGIEEAVPEASPTATSPSSPTTVETEVSTAPTSLPVRHAGGEGFNLYDDFSDPAHEGSLNSDLWVDQTEPTCSAVQREGELVFTNEVSQSDLDCRIYPALKEFPTVPQIRRLESRIWISSDESDDLSEHLWHLETELPQGQWVTICAVYAHGPGAGANMVVRGAGSDDYFKNVRISHDTWHTLSLEVDPESLRISCYVDGLLIGSTVPNAAAELAEAETRVWMSARRYSGALATTHVDDVRIEFLPIGSETLAMYDDFNDPSFDGSLDPTKWVDQSDPTCSALQETGKLAITNEMSQEGAHCRLHLPLRDLPTLSEINILENSVWISSDHSDASSEHSWDISTGDLSQGPWYALCGVAASGEGAIAFIEVKNSASELYRRNIRISFDNWHTVSLEVDPETMEISCYADRLLIGSVIPDAAAELMDAPIRLQLVASRHPESQATAYIDDVRVDIDSVNRN